MKKTIFILSLFSVISCQFFDKKIPSEDELLEKRLQEIDWKTVDKFPSTESCDDIVDEELNKKCFFEFFSNTINEKMRFDSLSKLYPKNKILNIKITVAPNERLAFESIISDSLLKNKPKIDSILNKNLVGFPLINPATKKGIPVKTQFIVPYEVLK